MHSDAMVNMHELRACSPWIIIIQKCDYSYPCRNLRLHRSAITPSVVPLHFLYVMKTDQKSRLDDCDQILTLVRIAGPPLQTAKGGGFKFWGIYNLLRYTEIKIKIKIQVQWQSRPPYTSPITSNYMGRVDEAVVGGGGGSGARAPSMVFFSTTRRTASGPRHRLQIPSWGDRHSHFRMQY